MKLLLAAACCVFSILVSAQNLRSNPPRVMLQSDMLQKFRKMELGNMNQAIGKKNDLALGNNRIVDLPRDQMPCIVPDTKDIAAIPNAWINVLIPFRPSYQPIPNPALPPVTFKFDVTEAWSPNTK